MTKLLGPASVELVELRYLDWTAKTAEASIRQFIATGPHIDALWAANDPMALGAISALNKAGYKPGEDVLVGGLNWSQFAVKKVLDGEMVVTYGGHFLLGAWAMVVLRDYYDGRDFAEEDVRLQIPMGAIDLSVARRFPTSAIRTGARSTSRGSARPETRNSNATSLRRTPCWPSSRRTVDH